MIKFVIALVCLSVMTLAMHDVDAASELWLSAGSSGVSVSSETPPKILNARRDSVLRPEYDAASRLLVRELVDERFGPVSYTPVEKGRPGWSLIETAHRPDEYPDLAAKIWIDPDGFIDYDVGAGFVYATSPVDPGTRVRIEPPNGTNGRIWQASCTENGQNCVSGTLSGNIRLDLLQQDNAALRVLKSTMNELLGV